MRQQQFGKKQNWFFRTARRIAAPLLVAGLLKITPADAMQSRLPEPEPKRKNEVYGLINRCKLVNRPCMLTVMKGDVIAGVKIHNGNLRVSFELKATGIRRKGILFEISGDVNGTKSCSRYFVPYGMNQTKLFKVAVRSQNILLLTKMDVMPGNHANEAIVSVKK